MFRSGSGLRSGVLDKVLSIGLVCSTLALAGAPRPALAAASPVAIGTHDFGRIVVDPATSQVFISSPGDNLITVLDLMGNPVTTITGEPSADGMAIFGGNLYVALFASGAIDVINTTSHTKTRTLVTGLVQPGDVAYAGGKLWTTTGACSGGAMKPVSIDLTAVTPTATTYNNVFDNTNGLQYCAKYATNHASNPSFLVAFGGLPATFDYMDVSGSTPVITKSVSGGANDIALTPDGTHFIVNSITGCTSPYLYCYTEYKLSDLSIDGISYPSERFPNAVDTTGAHGAKLAGGVAGYNSLSNNTDFLAYAIGNTSTVLTKAWFGTYETNNRGVAISPDGLTAYVVANGGSCNLVACEQLNLIALPDLPANGAPAAPTGVTATAGIGAAAVSWTAPTYPGTSAITGYTVSSSGGATVSVGPTAFNTIIAGLSPVPHTFTVTASNSSGPGGTPLAGDTSQPSNSVTPLGGGTFHPVTPARILDTRNGNGGYPIHRVPANTVVSLQVTGRGGVPATGVSAVVLNVTAADTTGNGYVTVYPGGNSLPLASNLNFTRGSTVPNLVEVGVSAFGRVNLFVGGASANLVADVEGWVGDSTNSYFAAGLYQWSGPGRLYDSRYISTANGDIHQPLGPGQSLVLNVGSASWLGASPGAQAVILNVTATGPTRAGYLTVYPTGSPQPLTSNLNFVPGQTVPNRVIVGLGTGGQVTIANGPGSVDVVVDVDGWFSSGAGGAFVATAPYRFFDTRTCGCKMPPNTLYDFKLSGPSLSGISFNATVTNPTANGYLTIYGDNGQYGGEQIPLASDLNFTSGQTVANMTPLVIPPAGPPQAFNVYNGFGFTDVILDISGYYGPITNGLVATGGPGTMPVTTQEPSAAAKWPVNNLPPTIRTAT
jgi:hypothetical protein